MSERPNILFLFTDQQRRDTIAAAGASWMRTPNLDRLVREGCTFTHAYSPNPVCVPARHCLLTGRNCEAHGYYANAAGPMRERDVPTYPQVLSDAGYHCGAVGKQHFQPPTRHHGFDELMLMEELPRRRHEDAYASWLAEEGLAEVRNLHGVRPAIYHQPQRAQTDAAHHGSAWVAEESIAFLRRNQGRPWFLMASFIHPHPPWNIPDEWAGLYDGVELPEAVPRCRRAPFHEGETDYYGDRLSAAERRAERAAYATAVSMVDHAIGRILAELEDQGLLEDTAIVFSSDHGEMLQDRGFYQKALPYESASGVPLILRAPGRIEPGSIRSEFVDLIDLMPTFLDLAGADFAPYAEGGRHHLAGSSLLRLDEDDETRDRRFQWTHFGTGRMRWISERDARYKYVFWYNGGLEECYDLETDPGETRNLVGTAELPEHRFATLRNRCFFNERRHGPPDHLDAMGLAKPFPLEVWPETHWEGSRVPMWSNMQFQRFAIASGEPHPDGEAERFRQEYHHALGDTPAEAVFAPPDRRATYEEHLGYL